MRQAIFGAAIVGCVLCAAAQTASLNESGKKGGPNAGYTTAIPGGSLADLGNDPAYPPALYFIGVATSPKSQSDADNLAISQIQKQITVTIRVQQESGVSSKRKGNQEEIERWLNSRSTLSSRGNLQGVDIIKRTQRGKDYVSVAVLKKSKFAAEKRLAMQEAAKSLKLVATNAQADAESGKIADALSARSRIEELIRVFEGERLLLSAAEPLTEADTLPISLDQINRVFDKALKKLSIEVVSGADQSLTDPNQAFMPWVVVVKADGIPVPELPLKLIAPDRKVVRTAISDAQGQAVFYPDAFALRAAGEHIYKVMADLQVSRSQIDMLERKRADFRYTLVPPECKVRLNVSGAEDPAAKALTALLANYGLKHDLTAKRTLNAALSAEVKGVSQGLSDASTFTMQEVSLSLTVSDAAGRNLHATTVKAMGHGNKTEAIQRAINRMNIGPDASALSKAACGDGSPAKPLPTLAILPFAVPRYWYSDEARAALLADMIAGSIHRAEAYQIVERTRINELLSEQSLGATGVIADPVEMGQMLGAQFVMMGTLVGDWSAIRVEGRIVEVSTGKVVKTFSAGGSLDAIAEQIARQIM